MPVIERNYEKFTAVEKNIADFFINNQAKVDFSSKAIADRLYVSEASLSRFAQKCGFDGCRQFIYRCREGLRNEKKKPVEGGAGYII